MKNYTKILISIFPKILKYSLTFIFLLILLTGVIQNKAEAYPYIVGVKGTNIQTFRVSDYTPVTDLIPLTLDTFDILEACGITLNTDDNKFYAVLVTRSWFWDNSLVTVDPLTGVCTYVGYINERGFNTWISHNYINSLIYSHEDSLLYTMNFHSSTVVGPSNERVLATIRISDAFYSNIFTIEGGGFPLPGAPKTFQHAILYNNTDGYFYNWREVIEHPSLLETSLHMEKINRNTFDTTNIRITGLNDSTCRGAVHLGGDQYLLTTAHGVYRITSEGAAEIIPEASALAGFKGFAIVNDFVLPVELSSFVSFVNGNNVKLNWTTAAETNNSGFEIERSQKNIINPGQWVLTGSVKGNGNSSVPVDYTFTDKNLNAGNYSYRLKQTDFNGNSEYFYLENEVVIGVPGEYELSQNYPNPFNPETNIRFNIPTDGKVKLTVFDISGKEVASLINDYRTAGYYSISFNASGLSSGVYYYMLSSGEFSNVRKMILVK
ncbi:MAG TPA: T9SS type A sorting domain-containing protein, partial [Ignavibacteria bacterium]|nr:T9SS type A sorting domain-containing protein [Ignavibacteria bacterium]